ncbi:possible methyltransferase [Rhodococcus jostii RHA1]|uniref:Possible methyltransferase n=1 Tax=Rhodococcus jostii (strain RHA1) TaxID=101510 RepID=Q0S1T1_RHOJR|nr:50S ribosomal protein L11 methyltransferase [Rhodococcus jostii]ABG98505.1 possible methyltransferase [Rhodococcus jostii RHA1]
MLVRLPGVYRPQRDTWLLAEVLAARDLGPGTRVLDLCCGTGVLSVEACAAGAGWVTAVDVSRRAAISTWLNAKLRRRTIRVVRGLEAREMIRPGQRTERIAVLAATDLRYGEAPR